MPEFKKIEEISDSLKQYLILNYEIVKLYATERASVIGSSLISSLIVGLSAFFVRFYFEHRSWFLSFSIVG
jgi:hypothetical protein